MGVIILRNCAVIAATAAASTCTTMTMAVVDCTMVVAHEMTVIHTLIAALMAIDCTDSIYSIKCSIYLVVKVQVVVENQIDVWPLVKILHLELEEFGEPLGFDSTRSFCDLTAIQAERDFIQVLFCS